MHFSRISAELEHVSRFARVAFFCVRDSVLLSIQRDGIVAFFRLGDVSV